MSSRDDALAARAARQVQEYAPTWLVIWSLRHRRFEAWECTDPAQCRIIHADSAGELWDLMRQVELDLWRTVFSWGPSFTEEPVDHAPTDDSAQAARRIAKRLGEHHPEPKTAP